MTDQRAYILRETAISAVINIGIGALFFLVLFGGLAHVPLWGAGGVVIDCLPQGFMVGLMSVLPPGFLTRSRIARGAVQGRQATARTILTRAVLMAIVAMLGLTAIAAALAWLSGGTHLAFLPALLIKALAGGIVAMFVTPAALRALLN